MSLENHAEGKNPIVNVLSMRDFRLLFAGVSTTLLGDQFTLIATFWLVLQLSSDPLALAGRLTVRGNKRVTIVGAHSQDRRLKGVDYGRELFHAKRTLVGVGDGKMLS